MLTIRVYNDVTDNQSVVDLWRAVFGYEAAHNDPSLAIERKMAINDGMFFVAATDASVVGTVMAGYDGHRGWLYAVAVDSKHRRLGLGRTLVERAEEVL